MINPYAHPPFVRGQVIDSIGNHLTQLLLGEVVHLDALGLSARLPFAAPVTELPDQFLFLGIHRHDWVPLALERLDSPTDVLKLRLPIRMVAACERLAIG